MNNDIQYYSTNCNLRSCDGKISFRYSPRCEWQVLDITEKRFSQVFEKTKNSMIIQLENQDHFLCVYKKPIKDNLKKVKVYLFENKPMAPGGYSFVYSGHKLNGKSSSLKAKVMKKIKDEKHSLMPEKEGLDRFLGDDKKLPSIQERFEVVKIRGEQRERLITKRYQGSLRTKVIKKLTLFQKVDMFAQLALALSQLEDRKMITLDIKTNNIVYNRRNKNGDLDVALIDIAPFTEAEIRLKIALKDILPEGPAKETTAYCLTMYDFQALSDCVAQRNAKQYFQIGTKMMVYQMGMAFLTILTTQWLTNKEDLEVFTVENKSFGLCASVLDDKIVEQRVSEMIGPLKQSQNETLIIKIETLLLRMLKVKAEERIGVEEVVKEVGGLQEEAMRITQHASIDLECIEFIGGFKGSEHGNVSQTCLASGVECLKKIAETFDSQPLTPTQVCPVPVEEAGRGVPSVRKRGMEAEVASNKCSKRSRKKK